ncbi:Cellulose-binding domain protein [Sandaracinus amylolyticus]|uniref:Cellulose-binding domain protein n=1 Tax=Sandaracinus amylolyticus TaxID=927083 RepID=A0A0F6SDV5_9BACT|nr:Cellulose-binding domain protein [Sandaracinus amylolyticus]
MRRLSVHELRSSIATVFGVETDALDRVPPDRRDFVFDRIAQSQTASAVHVEAFGALGRAIAESMIENGALSSRVPACSAEILPPAAASATTRYPGGGMALSPTWAVHTETSGRVYLQYPEEAVITVSHAFPSAGRYRLTAELEPRVAVDIVVSVDGRAITTWSIGPSSPAQTVELEHPGGTAILELRVTGLVSGVMYVDGASVEGPLDPGAARTTERRACAEAFVDTIAPLAWRRPLRAEDRARLLALYDGAGSFRDGFRMIVEAIIESPRHLYLVEIGEPVPDREGHHALDDWELASRLSYLACESPPDAMLRADAARGALRDPEVLASHATRLFGSACAEATVVRFFEQWLGLDRLPEVNRDPTLFPEWNDDLRRALREDASRFVVEMVFRERAGLDALYTARRAWPSAQVAAIYGIESADDGAEVALPETRAGMLTLPALMAVHAKPSETSPVHRGVFVVERLLCQHLPPPPAELDIVPPVFDPTATTRERWSRHSSDASCSYCHRLIDPVGFAMEDFDAIGRHRTTEAGRPIDARGGLPALSVEDGSIEGTRALAEAIASSDLAAECFARQWTRFGLGRLEEDGDAETITAVREALRTSAIDAMVALTRTYAFTHRVEPITEGE